MRVEEGEDLEQIREKSIGCTEIDELLRNDCQSDQFGGCTTTSLSRLCGSRPKGSKFLRYGTKCPHINIDLHPAVYLAVFGQEPLFSPTFAEIVEDNRGFAFQWVAEEVYWEMFQQIFPTGGQ